MKIIIPALAAALFSTGAAAGNYHHGFADGNRDLYSGNFATPDVTAMQPGIGSGIDRYHGWADGNADLFGVSGPMTVPRSSGPVKLYGGFSDNPDL